MSGTRAISTTWRRELSSSFFFLQGKAPKEIQAILTETLACFLSDRVKDLSAPLYKLDCVWNVMAHAQKPDLVYQRNGRVHLNRRGRQFSRLLAAEVCASAVVMLDTPRSEVVWRVLATHSIRQFHLHFPPPVRHRVPSHFKWTLHA